MTVQRWYSKVFVTIPLIYAALSVALAGIGWILDARDPNSSTGFALALGVIVANLPGAKTISTIYTSSDPHGGGVAALFYLGSIAVTAFYLGILLYLISRLWKRYRLGSNKAIES